MNEETLKEKFAIAALHGLLASGHFTYPKDDDDEGPWFHLEEAYVLDKEGNDTGRKRNEMAVVEAAWRVANCMIRDRQKHDV